MFKFIHKALLIFLYLLFNLTGKGSNLKYLGMRQGKRRRGQATSEQEKIYLNERIIRSEISQRQAGDLPVVRVREGVYGGGAG
jgi:hypothetical protein